MHLRIDDRSGRRRQPRGAADPIARALDLLAHPRHGEAVTRAVEACVSADLEERKYFAAAAGKVKGLSGSEAIRQAVRNYLLGLRHGVVSDRATTLARIAEAMERITGTPSSAGGAQTDPFAAAEALFRRPA
ncbi:hypothetical protein [Azospirillum halopraeferens]|uniref:hypothetical protein n=1 Tax=Azospirillum halopraeferens TaxID=34010 RepID=UPI00041E2F4E|nr:hypothetical protein [Azospirillum halopraeferens]